MKFDRATLFASSLLVLAIPASPARAEQGQPLDEITVWGQGRPVDESRRASPTVLLTEEDLVSINAMTTEDLVKYEPSLIIRQRYIGDPNSTLGMRSANMFQTARTSVYADGVPLHYFLQTAFNGAPRWALVGGNEVGAIEVVYGPFSAEYGGNAMGGVVNIETRIPVEREVHFESAVFAQEFDELGFDDRLGGSRYFGSFGNKWGNLSLYTSWIHLANDSQPMDFRFAPVAMPAGDEPEVRGGIAGVDSTGTAVINYGDSGVQAADTDQFKVKVGYDFGDWFGLLNLAFEDRETIRAAVNNYVVSATTGEPVWNGAVVQDGIRFEINGSRLTEDLSYRENLLVATRLQGPLPGDWWLEANLSYYEMLTDERLGSLRHPQDPAYTPAGRVRAYDDTGWRTAELKLETDRFLGREALEFVTGYQFATYSMTLTDFDSPDYRTGIRADRRNSSGGETTSHALFAQLGWQLDERWDVLLGARQEFWESEDGFLYNFRTGDLQDHADRSERRFSPKLSVGFEPTAHWRLRYSIAKAYRFPIVEELFAFESDTVGTALADAMLEPEDGLHHNFMIERARTDGGGSLRLNLMHEVVDDVIFSQSGTVDNVLIRTFLPVDEVTTTGAELVYDRRGAMDGRLDWRLNMTWMDAEITRNRVNTAIEGNEFPRLPEWRGNLVLTWHMNDRWDVGGGVRYASKGFQQLDNSDVASEVYGVMDRYVFVNLRSNYRVNDALRLSF
ncbi:MAG: TonB-dependent receptor, partial [Woeseiaceae bacterium]|nr:TonB-dependent receptor [Woeseiaceae bacterium]